MAERKPTADTAGIKRPRKGDFVAVVGLSHGDRRYEPGDTCGNLPEESLKWLVEQGLVKAKERGRA